MGTHMTTFFRGTRETAVMDEAKRSWWQVWMVTKDRFPDRVLVFHGTSTWEVVA